MEITQIRYFLEVAHTQHMTSSAEHLHIAQPALSQAIHRLEKNLGVPLFESRGRNIVLTKYGKYLESQLTPVMALLDSLPETLQTMAKLHGETVHLNVLAASATVTGAIIEYKRTHSEVNFQLLQNTEEEDFDIEISSKLPHQSSAETDCFVCPEKIFLAVPRNDRFRELKTISLGEVADEGFVSLIGSRQFRFICDKFCRRADISPRIIFESDNPAAVRNMIAANLGVGFWPEFTWGSVDSENVKLLEITDPVCSRDIVISRRHDGSVKKTALDFFNFLREYFTEQKEIVAEKKE